MFWLDLFLAVLCFRSSWKTTKITHNEAPPCRWGLGINTAQSSSQWSSCAISEDSLQARFTHSSFDFSHLLWILSWARTCGECWGQRCEPHEFLQITVIKQTVQSTEQKQMVWRPVKPLPNPGCWVTCALYSVPSSARALRHSSHRKVLNISQTCVQLPLLPQFSQI